MSKEQLIKARLVYDGAGVSVPPEMGKPRPDQLTGTPRENLAELAGRVCYDSLGFGRDSNAYHAHLLESKHMSVYQHVVITAKLVFPSMAMKNVLASLANRPGVWFLVNDYGDDRLVSLSEARVTYNACAVIERNEWFPTGWCKEWSRSVMETVWALLTAVASAAIPGVIPLPTGIDSEGRWFSAHEYYAKEITPTTQDEEWVSMYLSGSRGFSHEQVRHRYASAVSQRSTRYCDESESRWVEHPLVTAFKKAVHEGPKDDMPHAPVHLAQQFDHLLESAQHAYTTTVGYLGRWLEGKGVDKTTARKQARGAARGDLGNALQTEMIFSATTGQWRRMLLARASPGADAEIRQLYAGTLDDETYPCIFNVLRDSRYSNRFTDLKRIASPDGIGLIVTT